MYGPADDVDQTAVNPVVNLPRRQQDGSRDGLVGAPAAWEGGDMLDDEEFLPQPPKRLSRLTTALVLALVCAIGLFAGLQLGKVAVPSGAGAAAAGFRAGGQNRTGAGPSGSGTDPVAVAGTLTKVKGSVLTVTDRGGTAHLVTVTAKTPVTRPFGSSALEPGSSVSVTGTVAEDGSVEATSVTVR